MMSESKNDEFIEISITDILCRLWCNKYVFILVLIVTLVAGGFFVVNKNYNNYTYSANVSLPMNSMGDLLVNSKSVSDIFSNKYPAESKKLGIENGGDGYSINLTYSLKQPIQSNNLDKKMNSFVESLNSSDFLKRATVSYVNSLNEAREYISFLKEKIKKLKSEKMSATREAIVIDLERDLMAYKAQEQQARVNLKNAKFTLNKISIDHSKTSKKKYILVVLVLSFMLAVLAALGVSYLREKFLTQKP